MGVIITIIGFILFVAGNFFKKIDTCEGVFIAISGYNNTSNNVFKNITLSNVTFNK